MINPFKKETSKQPFNAPVIEMRKKSYGSVWWTIFLILTILVLGIFLFLTIH
jgi:hypothetical protein